MSQQSFSAIVFDLGDVLFGWSPETKTSISSKTLRGILSSPTWHDYERGRLNEGDCYTRVGDAFNLDPEEIRRAFQQARDSLVADHSLVDLIQVLKSQSEGRLRIFAMSNISIPDWEVLRTKPADWTIFDQVFTSGGAGERKPSLAFYRHVIAEAGIDPLHSIFVDDKLENVLSARSLGFHGIVFDDHTIAKRTLCNLVGDPVKRAQDFLNANAGNLLSVTESNKKQEAISLDENFAQLLILEATNDRHLVNLVEHPRTWNFFHGKGQLTTEEFPFDLDTTSLALTVMKCDKEIANSVIDEMLEYVNSDGIIQTYFDHQRPRFDPVVCVNTLTLFSAYGRSSELRLTQQWVYQVLMNRAYLDGTRYYDTAESFLYFLSRLLATSNDRELHDLMKPLLKERIEERVGAGGDSLALAMRVLVCDSVGIRDEIDLRALLPLQCEDGGWEIGWIYKYGSSGVRIGNRGLSTAFAIKAIETIGMPRVQFSSPPSPDPTLVVQPPSPTKQRHSINILEKRPRCRHFRAPFQWLLHGWKTRKAADV